MNRFSLAWSGHQAVLFGHFNGSISHTWLVLGTNGTHSWRSLMSLQPIVAQKVAIIPPLTQQDQQPTEWLFFMDSHETSVAWLDATGSFSMVVSY